MEITLEGIFIFTVLCVHLAWLLLASRDALANHIQMRKEQEWREWLESRLPSDDEET